MFFTSGLIFKPNLLLKINSIRCVSYVPRKRNYYDILGVDQNATIDEIKNAFAKKTRKLHPDTNIASTSKGNSTEKFMELKEAYDLLKKPDKRKEYDRELEFSRSASREMFYENLEDNDPDVINLNVRGPQGYGGARQRVNVSKFGHFFNPAKEVEHATRDERIWKILGAIVLALVLGNVLFVNLYRAKTLKVIDKPVVSN